MPCRSLECGEIENTQLIGRMDKPSAGQPWVQSGLRLYSSSIVFGVMKGGEGREVAALSSESDLYPNFVL